MVELYEFECFEYVGHGDRLVLFGKGNIVCANSAVIIQSCSMVLYMTYVAAGHVSAILVERD